MYTGAGFVGVRRYDRSITFALVEGHVPSRRPCLSVLNVTVVM